MKRTVLELFNLVVQEKNEFDFYQENIGLEVEDYLESITSFLPREKRVITSKCHEEPLEESTNTIANMSVEMEGLMVYYFVLHDDEFGFVRIENYNELYKIMKLYLSNCFIGDLIVFENGKKKNYCVKDKKGEILHSPIQERSMIDETIIEWY